MSGLIGAGQVKNKLKTFVPWLQSRGAQVIDPTNEWELVRFQAGDTTSIIYQTKAGSTTMTGEAMAAWLAFRSGSGWRATGAKPARRGNVTPKVRTILARDGDRCFFCNQPLLGGNITVEHLVAVTHGGPSHISNLFLAHSECNSKAGHLSAPEKISIHVAARMATN